MAVFEFVARELQEALTRGFADNELCKAVRAHLRICVPHVYSGLMNADAAKEEGKARRFIFKPFETFLCGGDPEVVFEQLKNEDSPSHLCGKVFKLGEPTYSCRDCGMDPTCVLCIDCFKGSSHRTHRYRMSTSGGGGYCDCGDVEAWKTDPYCETHRKAVDPEKKDPLESMNPELRSRAQALFTSIISTATELMCWEDCGSLPQDLRPDKMEDTYVTMLFNDEVHTYEQVISALTKAVNADQRKAVQFATTVDREGRSPVKDGVLNDCQNAKEIIIRQTTRAGSSKPLKTCVMHSSVVASQLWAMRALSWLQEVTNKTEGLRKLFCHIILDLLPGQDLTVVEQLLLADTKLWKAARVQTHELIMSGVLLDQECKKKFAVLFTKNYASVMRDFIADDHERKVSVISSSVQIFTNPTLARMLITEHNLLQVILDTFLAECSNKINVKGTFVFEKQTKHHSFRRAQYAFYDLKYALVCKPGLDDWDDALRKNFINGFQAMLKLLKYMQNMDAVSRQVGQHIEFDPEWETAFNLQLKLENDITMFLDWCGMDKAVLFEAFREAMECLESCEGMKDMKWVEVDCAGKRVPCIKYDVSKDPVSVHLPVNRILAGLFAQTAKYNFTPSDLLTSVSSRTLGPEQMMEHSLRVQVLVAQTQANMWKRNGYSLLNQIYFYQNVRCRTEMFDRDILMLQTGAALLDNNHFILHLLNKFGLSKWKQEEFDSIQHDELTRYTITLAEEFLNLILTVVGERYTVGVGQVTKEDVIKHEIIHQLCLHPMSHSELTKALPEDPYRETGIEGVVSQVANFKKPSASQNKGLYELKDEFFKEYNPFFFHYSRQEQSGAMDAQKARQKQQANDNTPPVLCPPLPPPFTPGYANVALLLNCDVMHYVMQLVLARGLAKRSKSWSETQYEKVLFLIGIALHEEKRALDSGDKSYNFVDKARACTREDDTSLYAKLEEYLALNKGHHQSQRDLLTWILKMFTETRQMRYSANGGSNDPPMEVSVSSQLDEKTVREREKKAKKAAQRRAKIMAQMARMQKNFIQENSELFENTSTELQRVPSDMDISGTQIEADYVVAIGPGRSSSDNCPQLIHTCILCQEEQECTSTSRAMVLASFVQRSTVLSQERGSYIEDGDEFDPTFMPANLLQGTHTTTCGHVMHSDCWQGFYDNVILRERRRAQRFRQSLSYDLDNYEYLCPYCKALSNTVIPIVPYLHTLNSTSEERPVSLGFHDWLAGLQKTVSNSIQESRDDESDELSFLFEPCPLSSVTKMMQQSVAQNFQALFQYVLEGTLANFSEGMNAMLKKFSADAYAIGLGVEPDEMNSRVALMAWNTCAYSIMTAEQLLRYEEKAVFEDVSGAKSADCLGALVRHAAVCPHVLDHTVIKKHCVNLLSALILEDPSKRQPDTPCILNIDMFHYLVSLSLSLPTLYAEEVDISNARVRIPRGGLNDVHILHLTLAAHLCQILLSAQFTQQAESMDTEANEEGQALLNLYHDFRKYAGIQSEVSPSAHQVREHVMRAVLPFLRSSAIFYQLVTSVAEPVSLKQKMGHEFDALCHFLGLRTNLAELFSPDVVPPSLVQSWCSDRRVKRKFVTSQERGEAASSLVTYPHPINELVELPNDYSELINKVSAFTCPNSNGDESRAPTMCLVCGEMLCSQSYCCQTEIPGSSPVGAATAHANTRGAGTGIFLRVRDCQILLLSGKTKGCFYSPPYLDDYGETDQGLRRGNPLHLCKDRYKKLQKLWLSHAIPEEIARHLEANAALISIEWNHL